MDASSLRDGLATYGSAMNSIRRHLSYANVVATLALVFAMSGGALATSHYLINSTKEINPKVLKKLKGHTGKAGARGLQGVAGVQGIQGIQGIQGPAGPFPGVLPRGITLRGNYNLRQTAAGPGFLGQLDLIRIPVCLGAGNALCGPRGHRDGCMRRGELFGQPQATPGNICFFSETANNQISPGAFDEATPFGAKVELESAGAGDSYDFGTWAATSP